MCLLNLLSLENFYLKSEETHNTEQALGLHQVNYKKDGESFQKQWKEKTVHITVARLK